MKKFTAKQLTISALIAAIYMVVTIINPFSYPAIQFRISEILVLLVFIDKKYIPGLLLGCILSNLNSPLGMLDVFIGTLASFLSFYLISKTKNLFIATLWPSLCNGILVGLELYLLGEVPSLLLAMGSVALGEFVVVSILGYIIFKIILSKGNLVKALQL